MANTESNPVFSFDQAVTERHDVTGWEFAASPFGGAGARCPSWAGPALCACRSVPAPLWFGCWPARRLLQRAGEVRDLDEGRRPEVEVYGRPADSYRG